MGVNLCGLAAFVTIWKYHNQSYRLPKALLWADIALGFQPVLPNDAE
jgi:hypothetical protein